VLVSRVREIEPDRGKEKDGKDLSRQGEPTFLAGVA
jgi:hypothetical protein